MNEKKELLKKLIDLETLSMFKIIATLKEKTESIHPSLIIPTENDDEEYYALFYRWKFIKGLMLLMLESSFQGESKLIGKEKQALDKISEAIKILEKENKPKNPLT